MLRQAFLKCYDKLYLTQFQYLFKIPGCKRRKVFTILLDMPNFIIELIIVEFIEIYILRVLSLKEFPLVTIM